MNLTPSDKKDYFSNTRNALEELQHSLKCQQCHELTLNLYHLGLCDHHFCKSCAEPKIGKHCPICAMLPDAKRALIDLQLSNIASLSSKMFQLLQCDNATLEKKTSEDISSSISSNGDSGDRGDSKFTNGSPKVADNDNEMESYEKPQRRSSRRNSLKSQTMDIESERESFQTPQRRRSSQRNLLKSQMMNSDVDNEKDSSKKAQRSKSSQKNSLKTQMTGEEQQSSKTEKKMKDETTSLLQPHLNHSTLRERSAYSRESPDPKQRAKNKTETSLEQSVLTDNNNKMEEDNLVVARKSRSRKDTSSATPNIKKKNTTLRNTPKANISKRNAKGETPLQVATIKADLNAVKKLLEAGANPNVKDNAGWTPLHEAVNHGNSEIASLLIANGASVNTPGLENDTPLHDAVSNYQLECVRLLVTKGANISARNLHGQTPMDAAKTEVMKELLLSGTTTLDGSDTNDQTMFEEAGDKTICLLTSVFKKSEQANLDDFQEMFNCKLLDNFSPEVTHLVTGTNTNGEPPRTMKYLSCIISGKWIVSAEWLQACIEKEKIVSEKEFLVTGSGTCVNASQRAVENRLKQLPGLFDGCQFYLYSKFPFSSLQREQIAELIKLGGGVILSREPRQHNLDDYAYTRPYHAQSSNSLVDCTIYKIYDDTCSKPPSVQSQRMACLPLSWLIDSIVSFALLEKTYTL